MKKIQPMNTTTPMSTVTCVVPNHVADRTRGLDFRTDAITVFPAAGASAGRATGFRTPWTIT